MRKHFRRSGGWAHLVGLPIGSGGCARRGQLPLLGRQLRSQQGSLLLLLQLLNGLLLGSQWRLLLLCLQLQGSSLLHRLACRLLALLHGRLLLSCCLRLHRCRQPLHCCLRLPLCQLLSCRLRLHCRLLLSCCLRLPLHQPLGCRRRLHCRLLLRCGLRLRGCWLDGGLRRDGDVFRNGWALPRRHAFLQPACTGGAGLRACTAAEDRRGWTERARGVALEAGGGGLAAHRGRARRLSKVPAGTGASRC